MIQVPFWMIHWSYSDHSLIKQWSLADLVMILWSIWNFSKFYWSTYRKFSESNWSKPKVSKSISWSSQIFLSPIHQCDFKFSPPPPAPKRENAPMPLPTHGCLTIIFVYLYRMATNLTIRPYSTQQILGEGSFKLVPVSIKKIKGRVASICVRTQLGIVVFLYGKRQHIFKFWIGRYCVIM